jgi:tryptophan synthase alpha chain
MADRLGRGFLYVISRLGVTGMRDQVADGLAPLIARVRAHSSLPIALGFGLSRPEHVRQVGAVADAAVVGSALVDRIAAWAEAPDLEARVAAFVRWLRSGGPPPEGA